MRRKPTLLVCLLLALITLAVYWPVRQFEFVNYDDPDNVTANPHVLAGLKPESLRWAFTNGEVGMWIPLAWLSLMADAELYVTNAAGYHLTNLLLHTVATLLLFGALRQMTGHVWRSAFVAALFAWHPFHVESVAWITERRDVLSACGWMLTLGLYARYAAQPSLARYLVVLAVYALALMSKPMLVTLPAVVLLLDWWPLGRVGQASCLSLSGPTAERQAGCLSYFGALLEKIPLLCLGALVGIVTLTFQSQIGSVATMEQLPVGVRAANAVIGYTRYLGKTFWPVNLAVFYPYHTAWPAAQVAGAAGLLLAITVGVVLLARRKPCLAVGWLWFVGTLFPVVGLFQAGSQSMADHYSYIPLIGLFVMLAWGLPKVNRLVLAGVAGAVLAACLIVTRHQLGHWQNSETLFRHALAVTTGNWTAHQNLGEALEAQGRDADAALQYRAALQLEPEHAEAHFNLANVLSRQGYSQEAVAHYQTALRLRPEYPKAHVNLGNLFLEAGNLGAAIRHYQAALVLRPAMAEAHNNLGLALAARGQYAEAIRHYEAALRVWPESDDVRANRAAAQRHLELAQPPPPPHR